jgi:hypothetical protein
MSCAQPRALARPRVQHEDRGTRLGADRFSGECYDTHAIGQAAREAASAARLWSVRHGQREPLT